MSLKSTFVAAFEVSGSPHHEQLRLFLIHSRYLAGKAVGGIALQDSNHPTSVGDEDPRSFADGDGELGRCTQRMLLSSLGFEWRVFMPWLSLPPPAPTVRRRS